MIGEMVALFAAMSQTIEQLSRDFAITIVAVAAESPRSLRNTTDQKDWKFCFASSKSADKVYASAI